MDIAIACAASAVGVMMGAAGATAFARDTIRKLKNGIACRDRKLAEAASLEEQLRGWLAARDLVVLALENQITEMKAKRSAATAAGNRKRRLNRLAWEYEQAQLENLAAAAFARRSAPSKTASVGEGV